MRNKLFLISFFFLYSALGYGQIAEVAPTQNLYLQTVKAKKEAKKAAQAGLKNLGLPFFDDFSGSSPFPDPSRWVGQQVYVNKGLGSMPPSIGVASFDGLNETGVPYGLSYGGSDTLTSQVIELGSFTASDSIYLSFYVQAKGFGDKPEAADSLVLEFLNSQGTWVSQERMPGLSGVPSTFIPDFGFKIYRVSNAQYLHDNFRFRFRNYSNRTGFIDVWNLDYVYLDQNRSYNDQSLDDVAFVYPPISQLRTYTAMPIKQFNEDRPGEIGIRTQMIVSNNRTGTTNVGTRAVQTIVNSSSQVLNKSGLASAPIPGLSIMEFSDDISLNEYIFGQIPFSNFTRVVLTTFYQLNAGITQEPFATNNDVVGFETVLDDYFAYDDGTAESNIVAQGQGTQVAVMYHVNEIDTLQGVRLHIPHIDENANSQLFNFKVWVNDLNTAPVFERNFINPVYVDSINGFTTISFNQDFVVLQGGDDFYVGWQQFTATSDPIPVGFDNNNPSAGQYNFFNSGFGWEPFPTSIQGALMIRPVFSTEQLVSTSVNDLVETDEWVNIFPNPVRDVLNVELNQGNFSDYRFILYNQLGQEVRSGTLESQINMANLSNGLYLISLINENGQRSVAQRILKAGQ